MQERKPTCPTCGSTDVAYIGDNYDPAAGIFHPEIPRSLVQAYKCECGTAFTFTQLPAEQVEQYAQG